LRASLGTSTKLDLRHAAIDGEIHAGDVRTFVRGEEHDSGRNFVGLTSAAKWNLRYELVGRMLGLLRSEARILKCWSLDWTGAYRIHADFEIEEPIPLTGGDCFLLARGTSIVLRDSPANAPEVDLSGDWGKG